MEVLGVIKVFMEKIKKGLYPAKILDWLQLIYEDH